MGNRFDSVQAADGKLLNGDVAYSAGSFEGLMDSIDLESLDLQRPSWPAEDTKYSPLLSSTLAPCDLGFKHLVAPYVRSCRQAAGLEQELTGAKAELKRLADVEGESSQHP